MEDLNDLINDFENLVKEFKKEAEYSDLLKMQEALSEDKNLMKIIEKIKTLQQKLVNKDIEESKAEKTLDKLNKELLLSEKYFNYIKALEAFKKRLTIVQTEIESAINEGWY